MFWIKSCPRCRGDLCDGQDQYGSFVSCLQCGFNGEVCSQPGELLLIASESSLSFDAQLVEGEQGLRPLID